MVGDADALAVQEHDRRVRRERLVDDEHDDVVGGVAFDEVTVGEV